MLTVLATLAVWPPQFALAQALAARSHKPTMRALLAMKGYDRTAMNSTEGIVIAREGQVFRWSLTASSSLANVPTMRIQSLSQGPRSSALLLTRHWCPNVPIAMKW